MARWDTRSVSKELMGFVARRYIAGITSHTNDRTSNHLLQFQFFLKAKGNTEIVLPAIDIDFSRRILKTQRTFANAGSDIESEFFR